jgi:hypothetical protein
LNPGENGVSQNQYENADPTAMQQRRSVRADQEPSASSLPTNTTSAGFTALGSQLLINATDVARKTGIDPTACCGSGGGHVCGD